MMNKEVRERWITALTSGEYKQAQGALRKGEGFCCLGVLTDLYVKENNGCVQWLPGGDDETYKFRVVGSVSATTAFLPKEVMEWACLRSDDPAPERGDSSLSWRNDHGYSFKEIADDIKEL